MKKIIFPKFFIICLLSSVAYFSVPPLSAEHKVEKTVSLTRSDSQLFSLIMPYDPIEPVNRCIFEFNDALYLWLFRPISKIYSFILPYTVRESLDNVVLNLEFTIRGVSCLLEAEWKGAWVETERFFIKLTIGVLGIYDAAEKYYNIRAYNEDFGQAFATWGIGPGFYFVIPVLGPSTLRDAVGEIFNLAFHPVTWIPLPGIGTFVFVNRMSLRLNHYLDIRDPSLDPYDSMKGLWFIDRRILIDNLDRSPSGWGDEQWHNL